MALLLSACNVATQNTAVKLSGAAAAVEAEIADAKRISAFVAVEAEVSVESRKYVEGKLLIGFDKDGRPVRQNSTCSTDLVKEQQISELREAEYKILNSYFQSIQKEFEPSQDIKNVSTAISGALQFVAGAGFGVPVTAELKVLIGAAEDFAQKGYAAYQAIHIAGKAKKLHRDIVVIIDRVSTGLISFETTTNAKIKLWEQCEYEKLINIKQLGDSSSVELERRYSEYVRLRNTLKGNTQDIDDVGKLALKLKEQHKRLFDRKLEFEDYKIAVSSLKEFYSSFKNLKAANDKYANQLAKLDE
jgi:hypothetical protein